MKICLIGEYSGNLDEGMRNIAFYFAEELSKLHEVLRLDVKKIFLRDSWKRPKNFDPQIIHYVPGPTIKSFVLLKILSLYCRNIRTVMSAMRPYFCFLSARLIPFFKPNLMLTQSYETEMMLKNLGCQTEFLPCGVDVKRFIPVTTKTKGKFKEKYGVNKGKFVILHVGSIKKGRNIQLLEKLQQGSNQVVIVGAKSTGVDQERRQQLEKSGCLVWTNYFERIEEIYALSDCYVFPTIPKRDLMGRSISDSIEMPLSVLEAMACDLPIISTRFGALPRVFDEGKGLIYADKDEDFLWALEKIKNGIQVENRERILPYSWENIAKKLERIYSDLISKP